VLGAHNYATQRISQGLGAVDPISICTKGDGLEALDEPSVGVINVDQIFAATDNLEPAEVIWESRSELAFLMLDSPFLNPPEVERMVGLPDGLAMYRARWQVWSGWHLFWHVEPFADSLRLVLRTGAVCEDMVLVPQDLVPTVVRAGMLEGDFRPIEAARRWDDDKRHARRRNRRARRDPNSVQSVDDSARQAREGRATFETLYEEYESVEAIRENPTSGTADRIGQTGLGLFGGRNNRQSRRDVNNETDLPQRVDYIKDIVRAPLEEMASEEEGLIITIFDSTKPESFYGLRDMRPRTPYARNQRRAYLGHWIRSANWALYFDKDVGSEVVTNVSPSYRPGPTVETDSILPRWKRNRTWDANFAGGAAFIPLRHSQYKCDLEQFNSSSFGFIEQCDPNKHYKDLILWTPYTGLYERTEGFGLDFSTFGTWWLWDEPRLALEMGLEVRADFVHQGESWFWTQESHQARITDTDTSFGFPFRPQGGAMFGLRHAPDPGPMFRLLSHRSTWGAEGLDGSTYAGRIEHGPRVGFLVGPGYNGLEGNVFSEWWLGMNTRRKYSHWSSFTPYHPIVTTNYYIRGQYTWTMLPDADNLLKYELIDSYTILTGFRIQFRTREPVPKL
jgi:hypothetical protein